MQPIAELIRLAGWVLFLGGFAVYATSIIYRMTRVLRVERFQREAFLVGFYARSAGMVGLMATFVAAVLSGSAPWISLLVVFIFGAPAVALLLFRPVRDEPFKVTWPRREKP